MKALVIALLIVFLSALVVHAGSEHLVKQRAKDLRDQNNAGQGVTPLAPATAMPSTVAPAQPQLAPTNPRPAAPALAPQVARIGESLAIVSRPGGVKDAQKQQLIDSLALAAKGTAKPSGKKIQKLGRDLAIAVDGAKLSSSQQSKLATQLDRALNQTLSAQEMEMLAGEVQDTLREAGAGKLDATIVANDVKAVIAEVQRNANN